MVDVMFLLQPYIKNGKVPEFRAKERVSAAGFVPPSTVSTPLSYFEYVFILHQVSWVQESSTSSLGQNTYLCTQRK